jgi:hypothetical protein
MRHLAFALGLKVFIEFNMYREESLAKSNRCFISREEFTSGVFCYSGVGKFSWI